MNIHKVSPSTLSFLFEECKACFWESVVNRRPRPSTPFPSVFNMLDKIEKDILKRIPPQDLRLPGLTRPLMRGELVLGDLRVRSTPFLLVNGMEFVFNGKMDMAYDFEDKTCGILDMKTAQVKPEYVAKYGRQLNAYRNCLEHPAEGEPENVWRMGLVYFTPTRFIGYQPDMEGTLANEGIEFSIQWVEVDFYDVATDPGLVSILSAVKCPAHESGCGFAAYYGGL